MLGSREIFEEKFKSVLEEAKKGEERCLQGRRWGGNALLIGCWAIWLKESGVLIGDWEGLD
jgi:hypothetical protein